MVSENQPKLPIFGSLPLQWRVVEFGSVLEGGTRNGVYKPKQLHGAGDKIVNMGELFAYPRLFSVPMQRIRLSDNERRSFGLKVGDLLFARRSLVAEGAGKCSIVCEVNEPTTFESSIIRARPDTHVADSMYLYYIFRSPYGAYLLDTIRRQVAVAGITGKDLVKLLMPLPLLPEQRAIAHILGTLDDKIELNRQMNQTLEAIARALFKSWFVDFDPVHAKAEDRQPYGMDAETAAFFPDSFEDSSLGKIPEGWNIKPLSRCVLYLSRGVAPSYTQISSTQVLNQRAIRWGHIDEQALKFHDSKKPVRQEAYIRKGDVVINSTGDITIGRAYWFYHEIENLFADSHVSIIRTSSDVLLPEIVVFQIETQPYQGIIYSYVTGSTGQLELNRTNLGQIPFLCPPIQLQRRFSAIIGPWFKLVWNNKEQSRILTAIRDSLLPKLLSGEIRVKDAEKFVEVNV